MGTAAWILALAVVAGLPGPALPAGNVVARVNDAPITEEQMETVVDQLIPRGAFHGSLKADRLAALREEAVERLIVAELQYQDAVARNLKPDQKTVKERMKQVRDSFSSKGEYKDWLKRLGRTEAQLKEMMERNDLISQARSSAVGPGSRMSQEQVREHYDRNPEKFKEPETVRIRIFSSKDRLKVDAALAEIAKGADFGDLAAKRSEDDFRIKGGDLGYVHRGRIFPELEEAAFRLKAGETAGPILSEGTWFLIKVEDRRSERQVPFDEIREKLKNDLEKKRAAELEKEWISSLRSKARIEVLIDSAATPSGK